MSLAEIILKTIQEKRPEVTPEFLKAITRGEQEADDALFDQAQEYALAHLLDVNRQRIADRREGLARELGL